MDPHNFWKHKHYGHYHVSDIRGRANYVQDIGRQRDDGDRRILGSNHDVHVRWLIVFLFVLVLFFAVLLLLGVVVLAVLLLLVVSVYYCCFYCCCCCCCLTLTLVKIVESVVIQRCWSPRKTRKTMTK